MLVTVYSGRTPLINLIVGRNHPEDGELDGIGVSLEPWLPGPTIGQQRLTISGDLSPADAAISPAVVERCSRMVRLWSRTVLGVEVEIDGTEVRH